MLDREHQVAARAEARQQGTEQPGPPPAPQRQPVWRGDSGPMTEAEERRLSDGINRVHRRGR